MPSKRSMGAKVSVLSGEEEAHFAALGALSGMPDFTGVVGDLGGGSLELSAIADGHDPDGETHELGVIRMQDDSGNAPQKALALARQAAEEIEAADGAGRRVLRHRRHLAFAGQGASGAARLSAAHGAALRGDGGRHAEAVRGDRRGERRRARPMSGVGARQFGRRDLVPYGAAVLAEVLKAGKFDSVVFSALGVREGYLYGLLDDGRARRRSADPDGRGDVGAALALARPMPTT